jgi:thiol:disulfide interchange protein DsbD
VVGLSLRFETRSGFKIYDKGLRFSVQTFLGSSWDLASTVDPLPQEAHDPWYDEVRATHSNGALFSLSSPDPLDPRDVVRIRFEACSVTMCLLPVWFEIEPRAEAVSVLSAKAGGEQWAFDPAVTSEAPVAPGGSAPSIREAPAAVSPAPPPQQLQQVESSGDVQSVVSWMDRLEVFVQQALSGRSPWLFPALFIAGLLMNLTPCVYPMIPITLNVLGRLGHRSIALGGVPTAAKDDEHWSEGLVRSAVYVAGIVLTYSAMGVVAGMTGTLFGSLLQSTAVVTFLAVLFVVLGFAMLGIIDFSRIQAWASRIPISEKSPHLGVFTMGAVSGLVSAPCTGPVLSAILVLIGQSQDPVYGLSLMAFFSLGFGSPYLVLGVFAHNLKRLPKAGRLLDLVKVVFAAMLFGLALYYVRPLLSAYPVFETVYANPGIQGFALGCALAVIFRLLVRQIESRQESVAPSVRPGRLAFAKIGFVLAMTQLALWLTLYLTNAFVVPAANLGSNVTNDKSGGVLPDKATDVAVLRWQSDWTLAVARARGEGKGLLVDAWAQWCAACLKMDAELWVDPEVIRRVNAEYIPLKLDFTQSSPFSDEIAKRWELNGLPGVAFFPAGANFEGSPIRLFRQEINKKDLFGALDELAPLHSK